jgi:hypothetical protein
VNRGLLAHRNLAASTHQGFAAAHDAFPRIPAQPAENGALEETRAIYATKAG